MVFAPRPSAVQLLHASYIARSIGSGSWIGRVIPHRVGAPHWVVQPGFYSDSSYAGPGCLLLFRGFGVFHQFLSSLRISSDISPIYILSALLFRRSGMLLLCDR